MEISMSIYTKGSAEVKLEQLFNNKTKAQID